MKKIVRIARLELSLLFYSPVAWIVLIIFTVQVGIGFSDLLYSQETSQQLGRPLSVITRVLFSGDRGILTTIQDTLYLYIPLLTMGVFSREFSSGSIKLLESSPVTDFQIVFGKFLSLAVFNLSFAFVLFLYMIGGFVAVANFDWPIVLSGILGIYLLMCAYASIGLFMSSLTSYQVVAAISTLAVLAAIQFIGASGQQYDGIRDITHWLSFSNRVGNIVMGLIISRDIIYFLLIIVLFLGFSLLGFYHKRSYKTRLAKSMSYAGLVVVVLGLGYVTSLPQLSGYYDVSINKRLTITENTQKLVDRLEYPLKISSYVDILHRTAVYGTPENRIEDKGKFEDFRRFLPGMKMDYFYYYDSSLYKPKDSTALPLGEEVKRVAKSKGFDFDEVVRAEDLGINIDSLDENGRLFRIVKYKDKQVVLRMFDDILSYPFEGETASAIKRLLDGPVKVAISVANGERKLKGRDASYISESFCEKGNRHALINQGFEIIPVDLDTMGNDTKAFDVLVLADPSDPYSDNAIDFLDHYVEAGGDLLVACDPANREVLNAWLSKTIGVSYIPGQILQQSEDYPLDRVTPWFTTVADSVGFKRTSGFYLVMPGAMGIQLADTSIANQFDYFPLVVTDGTSTWVKKEKFDLNVEKVTFDSLKEEKVQVPVLLSLQRDVAGDDQKIMISGDADLISNGLLNERPRAMNSSFILKAFKWFSDRKYPFSAPRFASPDTSLNVNRPEVLWMKSVYVFFLPLFMGLFGTFLIIKRNKK